MLTFNDILEARARIRGVAHRTPVLTSRQFNELAGCEVFFKAENLQRAGAFKFRGAYNKIASLTGDERKKGILAYSSGNHAQAVALASKLFGAPAVIVMPHDAPQAKVAATRGYGAEIIFYDRYRENREATGERISRERGLTLVPPFDDYLIMAGQGTAALELLEDVPELDLLLTPCSGCGLLAGCSIAARHLRPNIRIFGVEPEAGNDTWQSFRKGERVEIPVPQTIADGLQTAAPGKLTFPIVQRSVEDILLVSDDELIETMRFIIERMKLLVEPSGAAAAAAVQHRKCALSGKRVGVILSGGNVDLAKLAGYLISPESGVRSPESVV
jgi:threo-3-hydroxy-L-aspartate ammonia-lyase